MGKKKWSSHEKKLKKGEKKSRIKTVRQQGLAHGKPRTT